MNLFEALKSEYPADIVAIRNDVQILGRFSDCEVEHLWKAYSRTYAAGWLGTDEANVKQFAQWLEQ